MLNASDLPVDESYIAQQSIDLTDATQESAANVGLILGQLDPTEIDLKTGQPRWNEGQRALILKFSDALAEWNEE